MTADWDWELSATARDEFAALEPAAQQRIHAKLEEVVDSEWREPEAFLDPLTGVDHSKRRIGPYRLGCRLDRERKVLLVGRITRRGGDEYGDDD